MGTGAKVALGGAAALALLVAVVVGRTLAVKPAEAAAGPAPPAPVAVDANAAAARLGEAVRIQTVSHQDPRQNDASQWAALHDWLSRTYPHFAAASTRETVGPGALVWTWPGSDRRCRR